MRVVATLLGALVLIGALFLGPLGAAGAAPYVYGCTPGSILYGAPLTYTASLYNGSATTANVTMKLLAYNGANVSALMTPSAQTFTITATNTRWVTWTVPMSQDPSSNAAAPSTVRVVSDQPLALSMVFDYSSTKVIVQCTYLHP
jgi:hypothetical protein